MRKFIPVLCVAVAGAVVLCAAGGWLFAGGGGLLIASLVVAGFFMAAAQKETAVYGFLNKLLVGSVLFGLLAMALLTLRVRIAVHLTEGSPLSFSYLWNRDSLMMAAVFTALCFFGGLLGAVLKGFYALYGKKLDRVLLFAGPLLAALASLAVIKVKVGGTIMSALHGWPYPFVTYQVRDVLDGFSIDKWIFTPGSLYHYLLFDYLWYFSIVLLAFCAIAFINAKLKTKKINTTLLLFGGLMLMTAALVSYLPLKESYISRQIARAGACNADADCIILTDKCPFSCAVVVNRSEAERIEQLINTFPSTCDLLCLGEVRAVCLQNRCRVSSEAKENTTFSK